MLKSYTKSLAIYPILLDNMALSSFNFMTLLLSCFRNKSKEALNIAKNKGGKKKLSIEGDFFVALKKCHVPAKYGQMLNFTKIT